MKLSIEELDARWNESDNLMVLLPLLKHSYPEVLEEIESFGSISASTLTDLIEYSLRFPSRHWALSAVVWIENGFVINDSICQGLIDIAKDKSDSQKLRHKAFAQARRWQRENGT
ncbi:hypothetical protein L2725_10920 [Shewanella corallii]|uniref:Uncharacterized protein n=1 Tax=Shewanella corallii TaxID=560080 RepID=A0ABT0N778_9GAMM|nr:hypothetical protein [Shewanella corallii]MCL2914279.1 hypothetical protein [Shewanella corallii]